MVGSLLSITVRNTNWQNASLYLGGIVAKMVPAQDNFITFKLARSSDSRYRYTTLLALCNQNCDLVGLYAIGVSSVNEKIISIGNNSADVVLTRSGDNITITFSSTSIWANGILFAPVKYC